ncbi:hypothetical protein J4732_10455 [Serratia marcescens]|uniref:Uncharacterized protein n=1 Tax=Serratia marcescens TaxID=615 RepID=A0A939NKX4_SERMA|nr:hypothetical protein [Serratia marcescens]
MNAFVNFLLKCSVYWAGVPVRHCRGGWKSMAKCAIPELLTMSNSEHGKGF